MYAISKSISTVNYKYIILWNVKYLNTQVGNRLWYNKIKISRKKVSINLLFDYFLQGKVLVINDTLSVVYEDSVSYDHDLPEFGTKGGIQLHDDKSITVPTAMFVKALDMLLEKMMDKNFPFEDVVAIAGATQCNGSVFWKQGSRQKMKRVESDKPLYDQLKDAFSIPDAPTWMDSTATEQARQIGEAVGGQQKMIRMTGGRVFEK